MNQSGPVHAGILAWLTNAAETIREALTDEVDLLFVARAFEYLERGQIVLAGSLLEHLRIKTQVLVDGFSRVVDPNF